jgi:hypothetical protein
MNIDCFKITDFFTQEQVPIVELWWNNIYLRDLILFDIKHILLKIGVIPLDERKIKIFKENLKKYLLKAGQQYFKSYLAYLQKISEFKEDNYHLIKHIMSVQIKCLLVQHNLTEEENSKLCRLVFLQCKEYFNK